MIKTTAMNWKDNQKGENTMLHIITFIAGIVSGIIFYSELSAKSRKEKELKEQGKAQLEADIKSGKISVSMTPFGGVSISEYNITEKN